jgi:hypothetical protein
LSHDKLSAAAAGAGAFAYTMHLAIRQQALEQPHKQNPPGATQMLLFLEP